VKTPIDYERLQALRRYEDSEAGISEEFLERGLGSGRALALLSAPLREPRALGWVIAPSIGPEHGTLRRLETLVARRLAAAGFPTLRIRPDLHPERGALGEIDLTERLEDVDEAVGLISTASGVQAVGLIGMLVGGTAAALTAERLGTPGLVVVEPVRRGRQYVRETARRQAIAELIASVDDSRDGPPGPPAEQADSTSRPLEELAAVGHTWIRGLRLTRAEFERISAVNLVQDLRTFRGRSLVVGISPSGAPSTGLQKLHEHLESLGGDVTFETLQDPLPAPFGEYYYRNAGPVRIDTRLELDQRLADVTAGWAARAFLDYPRREAT